ncbi:MAG: 6-phosphogluconolactonase [Rhizobiaceae bacterium]
MRWHVYDTREELAEGLATGIAAVLAGAIAVSGSARLAVSGGTTPITFFGRLSTADIPWELVTIGLVDERFAPAQSPRLNVNSVRNHLMKNKAANARLFAMHDGIESDINAACLAANRGMTMLGSYDALVLGMGGDGHTASLFPGGDNLAAALDLATSERVMTMAAPGAGEPRLTMTLGAILDAGFLALHIEGAEKRAVLERALSEGDDRELPVRAVLRNAADRLQIFWAP